MKNIFIILLYIGTLSQLYAQKQDSSANEVVSSYLDKKLRIGGTFQQTWTTIVGNNIAYDYFSKPSIGIGLELQYFFSNNWGIGTGLAFQQRGAGIILPDDVKALGDLDSSHLFRLRMNCLDIPIKLEWRTNKGAFKGSRWSGSVGVIPSWVFRTATVFNSVNDGFHQIENRSSDFKKFDLAATVSGGLNINAAEACLLQVHLFASFGFLNPYNNATLFGNSKGNNLLIGAKAAVLF